MNDREKKREGERVSNENKYLVIGKKTNNLRKRERERERERKKERERERERLWMCVVAYFP